MGIPLIPAVFAIWRGMGIPLLPTVFAIWRGKGIPIPPAVFAIWRGMGQAFGLRSDATWSGSAPELLGCRRALFLPEEEEGEDEGDGYGGQPAHAQLI